MDEVQIHSVGKLGDSAFVKPMQVVFTQKGGKRRKWDYIRVHDSVAVLIYNTTLNCIVMVKQFRPAVYMHECHKQHEAQSSSQTRKSVVEMSNEVPPMHGFMHELCAGIVDKTGKTTEEIASMEVLEETGYQVAPGEFELVSRYRHGVGTHGSVQSLYYVEVTNDKKVQEGGGLESEGEMIETTHLPIHKIQEFLSDCTSVDRPSGVMFALTWFLANKHNNSD